MRHLFPELTLCDNNWKARSLLIEWYGNWNQPRIGVKEEEMDNDLDATNVPSKRKKQNGPSKLKKAKRVADSSVDTEIPFAIHPLFVTPLHIYTC
jgi:hypothetical protein